MYEIIVIEPTQYTYNKTVLKEPMAITNFNNKFQGVKQTYTHLFSTDLERLYQ